MKELIDLHIHTTASDGSFSPTEVVILAHKAQLRAIAITDHDTLSGLDEAMEKAKELNIECIRGCELSTKYLNSDVHILGFFIPEENEKIQELQKNLDLFIERRNRRNTVIIQKLRDNGVDITLEEIEKEAGGKVVARPHIANVLLQKKVVKDVREAFDNWLAKGQKAYVPRESITPHYAVELLHRAGALTVLAHPRLITCSDQELENLIQELIPLGLNGIEMYHSAHSFDDERKYLDFATQYNLCVSGGSDFHGKSKPNIEIGKGKGSLRVPACILADMKKRIPKL